MLRSAPKRIPQISGMLDFLTHMPGAQTNVFSATARSNRPTGGQWAAGDTQLEGEPRARCSHCAGSLSAVWSRLNWLSSTT